MSRLSDCREERNDVLEKSPRYGDFLKYEVRLPRDKRHFSYESNEQIIHYEIYRDPENHEEKKEMKKTIFSFSKEYPVCATVD